MKYGVACLFLIVIAIGYAQADVPVCRPGETKKEDCNTCTCTSTGVYACTRKLCLRKRGTTECQPGETKKVDCNTCNCYNGVFGCTRKRCITKREALSARFNTQLTREKRDEFSCTPGQTFSKECNTCTCTPDGKNAICTLMACGVNIPKSIEN